MKSHPSLDYIKNLVELLPDKPGVYQFFNEKGEILYVGKAKNLKKRVSSYFNKLHHDSNKVQVMVAKVSDIRHIVVETESDALLLENNLIKKYQPKYNVLLKDDKTFPWICVKNERFPRLFSTRNPVSDGSQYFGPYTSVIMIRTLLNLIRQLYKLRNCNHNLSVENIRKQKFKVCLEYHLGNCKAPCIGAQEEDEYNESIRQIKLILKGNISQVNTYLQEMMHKYSSDYKFEQAAIIKEKIEIIEKFRSKSTIVNPAIDNVDVFSYVDDPEAAYVNYLRVMNGAIVQAHTMELKKRLEETKEDLLLLAITELRQRFSSNAREILVPFLPGMSIDKLKFFVPKIGDKLKLVELSDRNAKFYQLEKHKRLSNNKFKKRTERILETAKTDLRLSEMTLHIECFDNSNLQGTNPVAACVVFRNGRPSAKDYRHFNIRTVVGPDDFSSMREVVYRRYKRMLDGAMPLPQLIIIDGGKGQLNAALDSLQELKLHGRIAVISIAKRLEEIYFPGDPHPLYIDKNSETLKLIQQIRNEAHRFGISFHKTKRSSTFLQSELEQIEGIGDKTIETLMKDFKSVSIIRELSLEQLIASIGKSRARQVFDHFNDQVNKRVQSIENQNDQ
jgi:excinuclease ABC subunit C